MFIKFDVDQSCLFLAADQCEIPDDKYSKLKEALRYLSEALEMRQHLPFTSKETAENHLEIVHVLKSLGQEKKAKEHEDKATNIHMKVYHSHMGEPMDKSTI